MTRPGLVALAIAAPALCHPPSALAGVLAFIVYVPLFLVLYEFRSRTGTIALGFAIGAAQAITLGHWSVHSLGHPVLALVALTGFVGILWSMACLVMQMLLRHSWSRLLAVLVIPLMEWGRASNPCLPISYGATQLMIADNLCFAQLAEAFGIIGVAVVLVAFSLAAADMARASAPKRTWRLGAWFAALTVLHAVGAWRLTTLPEEEHYLQVAVIQQYAPRGGDDFVPPNKDDLIDRLQRRLSQGSHNLVLLPEATLYQPIDDGRLKARHNLLSPVELAAYLMRLRAPAAITGIVIDVPPSPGTYRNAIGLVQPGKGLSAVRDKLVPAPIGEAVPFEHVPLLSHLGAALAEVSGQMVTLDPRADLPIVGGPRLAVAVCGEHMHPDVWRRRGLDSLAETDWQLVVADMSWFGYDLHERAQSRAARQLLAIRHRRPFLYVANGGSEWIDAAGRVRDSCDALAEGASWSVPYLQARRPMPLSMPLQCLLVGAVLALLAFTGCGRNLANSSGQNQVAPGT